MPFQAVGHHTIDTAVSIFNKTLQILQKLTHQILLHNRHRSQRRPPSHEHHNNQRHHQSNKERQTLTRRLSQKFPTRNKQHKRLAPRPHQLTPMNRTPLIRLLQEIAAQDSEQELSSEELKEVEILKQRDVEVKQHEQAHKAAAGQYARGGASFEYQVGPDGKRYAVGGEVQIDVGEGRTPEETIQKTHIVRQAALAPANPSAQDRRVAAQASSMEQTARKEIATNRLEEAQESEPVRASSEGASPEIEAHANAEEPNLPTADTSPDTAKPTRATPAQPENPPFAPPRLRPNTPIETLSRSSSTKPETLLDRLSARNKTAVKPSMRAAQDTYKSLAPENSPTLDHRSRSGIASLNIAI